MTTVELRKKIDELKELEGLIKEAQKEVENLKEELKAEMLTQQKEEIIVGRYTVRYKEVRSNKFDSKKFKEVCPDLYKVYSKIDVGMRFTITG